MTNTLPTSVLVVVILFSFTIILQLPQPSSSALMVTYNVVDMGAKPDGKTDSTSSFHRAWEAACKSAHPATIYVPPGRWLLLQKSEFLGPCNNSAITFQINGTLVAPSDYNFLGNAGYWLMFHGVNGVTILGGILDGQGAGLWACKTSMSKDCPDGATTLGVSNSNNTMIRGLTSLNSQLFHIVINGCNNVKLQEVKVLASGNSPNTDGIHVQLSSAVTIFNSSISTGDDCVSVGPGSTNLWIENVACGPGHGISIGSLGKELEEPGVQNVTVKRVVFTGTQNGVRIKTWARPSNGFVRGVLFKHATMFNAQNPIVIDQNYCPHNECKPYNQTTLGVKISDVRYQGIWGISATEVAVKFDCGKARPCSEIRLQNVSLHYRPQYPAKSSCSNANGTTSGYVQPASCLQQYQNLLSNFNSHL